MHRALVIVFVGLFSSLVNCEAAEKNSEAEKTDLEGAESQSYGFGYGTKVQDKYSVATGEI